MTKIHANKNRFDFEGGYITRSPCRNCPLKKQLPKCADHCRTLSKLHSLLTGTISCSNDVSECEAYSLSSPVS